MSFTVTHFEGSMERDVSRSVFEALLDELELADAEHTNVSVTHESEWCVSVFPRGRVVFENLEEGAPRHAVNVPRETVLEMLAQVADGEFGALLTREWLPGYPR